CVKCQHTWREYRVRQQTPGSFITGDQISEGIPGERGLFEGKVKAEVLKEVVDVVSTLVDEAKFNVGKDSITVKAVDPAHVAMVDLTLDRGAFEAYKADEGELGVDMDKMKEILRLAKGGETISFSHDEDKNRLVVTVGNTTRRMALVDTAGMSDPKVPSLNLPAKLVVRTDELRQAIRASESISDHIALKASPDGFEIVSEGDTDNVSHLVPTASFIAACPSDDCVRSRPQTPNRSRSTPYTTIPIPADAGIVMIQAQKIRRATPHRTADSRLVAPTPMIAEAITRVVLTGIPARALLASAMPPPVSAEKRCQGRRCVTLA